MGAGHEKQHGESYSDMSRRGSSLEAPVKGSPQAALNRSCVAMRTRTADLFRVNFEAEQPLCLRCFSVFS
jgi:hypothetical protein